MYASNEIFFTKGDFFINVILYYQKWVPESQEELDRRSSSLLR